MLPCTVVRCGASTPLRCGACGALALCSLACARAAWPEHRSGCSGALAERKDMAGDWLPAPEPVAAAEAPARSKLKGEAPADEASEAPAHAGAGTAGAHPGPPAHVTHPSTPGTHTHALVNALARAE
jgi:hypothetical protein